MACTKRIGIIALLHESNTFLDQPTTIAHFAANVLATGAGVIDAFRGSRHEVGGFISALSDCRDLEAVGIFAARAMPYGTITRECWRELMERLESALKSAGPLDGLLVAPHGATVAEGSPDADGDWLARVRTIVGPDVPIIGTLDLHANVSAEMVNQCQALFGYRTNPHLDQFERGLEAGRTLIATLAGRLSPRMSFVQLPWCINIERQATEEPHGQALWQEADRLQSETGMLSVSCLYGFPYADVAEMGATVLAVADGSTEVAARAARGMANFWWSMRDQFRGQLLTIDAALESACDERRNGMEPVGLLDMGDNVGGGSPGDGTWIAQRWLASPLRSCGRLLMIIADPEAVAAAIRTDIGVEVTLSVGGKLDPARHGPPLCDTFRVESISDGKFRESEARHGGYNSFDQGPTVVLEGRSGLTVIATTQRVAPMSLQQVLSQGLNPRDFAAIVIKGVHAPMAAYGPACSRLMRVNTPGVTTADLSELTYEHRRRPLEPFELVETWHA